MPEILVRGLTPGTVQRLKQRARRNGRSLQSEVKQLLERAAGAPSDAVVELVARWDRRLAGRRLGSSAALLRADRKR